MRLPQFNRLSEQAQKSLEIPDDAKIVNVIDKFDSGGPIVVVYSSPMTEVEKEKARKQRQWAIDRAIDAIAARSAREVCE